MDWPALGDYLGICPATISARMNDRSPWRLDEMYRILDLLGHPARDLPLLFPKDGQNEKGCFRGAAPGRGRRAARGAKEDKG